MLIRSLFLSIGIYIVNLNFFGVVFAAEVYKTCPYYDRKQFILNEYNQKSLRRQYFVSAKCEGATLSFYLESKEILRLLLCLDSTPEIYCENVILEGVVDHLPRYLKVSMAKDDNQIRIEGREGSKYTISALAAIPQIPEVNSFSLPITKAPMSIPRSGDYASFRQNDRLHTGVDIPSGFNEAVYSSSSGLVIFISHLSTQSSIFIKHIHSGGKVFFTSIAHLKNMRVGTGEIVSQNTLLGRSMNQKEFLQTKHKYNHVHLEVRKNIDDLGKSSVSTKSLKQLNESFVNPILPLKGNWKW